MLFRFLKLSSPWAFTEWVRMVARLVCGRRFEVRFRGNLRPASLVAAFFYSFLFAFLLWGSQVGRNCSFGSDVPKGGGSRDTGGF